MLAENNFTNCKKIYIIKKIKTKEEDKMEREILPGKSIILRLIGFFVLFGIIGIGIALLLESLIHIEKIEGAIPMTFLVVILEVIIFFLGRFVSNKIVFSRNVLEKVDFKKVFTAVTIYTVVILIILLTFLIVGNRSKKTEWDNDPTIKTAKMYLDAYDNYFGENNPYTKSIREMDSMFTKILVVQVSTLVVGYGLIIFYQYKSLKKNAV